MTAGALLVGKLPATGDFVVRGLDAAERGWWDAALARGLAAAEASVGAAFARLWDMAPPWRFAIATPAGERSGAIAASADAAGRRFPLVVARHGRGWSAPCEAALFAAFAAVQDADTLQAALLALTEPADSEPGGWWLDGGEAAGIAPLDSTDPATVLPAMLAAAQVIA